NGIGMSLEILKKFFLNIGVSYYKSEDYVLRDFDYKPIGNFGIGFLACFMLSEKVGIKTKHINDETVNYLFLEKNSPYISLNEEALPNFSGTEITLNYEEVMKLFDENANRVEQFLFKNFLTDDFEIRLIEKEKNHRSIKNPLYKQFKKRKNQYDITLQDYLNDIEGTITVNVKNKIYGKQISDIPYKGEAYFYDGEKLIS